jgi:putative aminopeptidase FrvX
MSPARWPRWCDDLKALVGCHSTPGDEDEVARYLRTAWEEAGWTVSLHGRSAVSARPPRQRARQPTLLICAHMDSPGFSIERIGPETTAVITLGKPAFAGPAAEAVLKTRDERVWLVLQCEESALGRTVYWMPTLPDTRPGDRLCFHGNLEVAADGGLAGPFLDNRLGCAVLCEMARRLATAPTGVNVVLGATACEEMGGFGAPVLAQAIRPDLVLCLDATYASAELGVRLGGGPVLTLSDTSVLLGCRERDRALEFAAAAGIPLQTEVYNHSGTDARAFPRAGLPGRVCPLLVPTTGNHSPQEGADSADIEALLSLLGAICAPKAWRSFFLSTF